ncbi:hypothetical protein [Micromonospora sp. WMMD1219]|uniref:hypothetical protein n=1 Tax=Micromonospora sp. WMMD1219 TaxID=3404115 RepID=UPI003BF48FD5
MDRGSPCSQASRRAATLDSVFSIRVELVTGRGRDYWPRPGRIFTTHRKHTFAQLAEAIDIALGRWDLAHLRMFVLADGVEMSWSPWRDGPAFPGTRDGRCSRLDELIVGTVFAYVFDLGEDWAHLCTVGPPDASVAMPLPSQPPRPDRGWGNLPDQYGRHHPDDRASAAVPRGSSALLNDLPSILPSWGPHGGGPRRRAAGIRSPQQWRPLNPPRRGGSDPTRQRSEAP